MSVETWGSGNLKVMPESLAAITRRKRTCETSTFREFSKRRNESLLPLWLHKNGMGLLKAAGRRRVIQDEWSKLKGKTTVIVNRRTAVFVRRDRAQGQPAYDNFLPLSKG